MAFLGNEDLLDRLQVQYNQDGSLDSLEDPYTDSLYEENYEDSPYEDGGESADFFPLPIPGQIIQSGINAARQLLGNTGRTPVNLTGVRPGQVNVGGITGASNLSGVVRNNAGRPFPIQLPGSVAEKKDIDALKQAVEAQNANIKRISDAVNKNAQETAKIAGEVNKVDAKHTAASQAQNQTLARLNTQATRVGKRMNTIGKSMDRMQADFKNFRQQSQMMALLPLFLQKDPVIDKINFAGNQGLSGGTDLTVSKATYKADDDSTSLLLPLMLMGGFGGDSGSGMGGDNMMLPLLLIALK